MLDTFTEWLEDFTGSKQKIKEYDGSKLRYKISGLCAVYAYCTRAGQTFGYNKDLMDTQDEATTMAIAAHEAGHYWTSEIRPFYYTLIVWLISMIVMQINVFVALPILLFDIPLTFYFTKNDEFKAEAFVRKTLGPAISLNSILSTIMDMSWTWGEKMSLHDRAIKEIKTNLKELEIDVDITES